MTLEELRGRLAIDLKSAMKARAATEVRTLRSLLAALDNATAVPLLAAGQTRGGPTEVPRRELTPDDVEAILARELAECEAAIVEYSRHERSGGAIAALRVRVMILRRYRERRSA